MLYQAYELTHAAIAPWRNAAQLGRHMLEDTHNPFTRMPQARATAAALNMFEKATRRYGKPEFGIARADIGGAPSAVIEDVVLSKPFCDLLRFQRFGAGITPELEGKVLIVAPMSGHFATLLRGTVRSMLPGHDVYITDWIDARNVPVTEGGFDLDDYIDYLIEFLQFLGPGTALMGVCQPGVPALAAAALMAERGDPCRPSSLVMMGSPIDTRISPTEPTKLAESRPLSWFERNAISWVPWPNPGVMRRVYPGFLQLSSFMAMNMDRHVDAHIRQFQNLVQGDGDSAAAHHSFYDEYMSVMDLTAEFYLQTIDRVFQRHLLATGAFEHRGHPVKLDAITDTAIMTIEGGKDDITGAGQTHAALALCPNLPEDRKLSYTHADVGHYGQFNGSKWRRQIQPRVAGFMATHRNGTAAP